MGFNTYSFILVFLPLVVLMHALAARFCGHKGRVPVLLVAGLVFYAVGSTRTLPVLLVSMVGNYLCARRLTQVSGPAQATWLRAGVVTNLGMLILFKYSGFVATNIDLPLPDRLTGLLILPLGLSFFTFQQIGFLVDVARGTCPLPRPLTYAGSIAFFPVMISGPVTYVRELAPQLEATPPASREDMAVGLGQFAIGLFKKTVIADSFSLWVDPLFTAVEAGGTPGTGQAWMMLLGYLMQMYFDFSGYSDMAAGIARMFGIRLAINFFSPLKVASIIDWWRRWHISLGRFVNDYIFQSLALPLTRRAMSQGRSRAGITAAGVLLPTAISMLVIGAWHGGRWTYFVFGALHAFYMVVAESWRFRRGKRGSLIKGRAAPIVGNLLTLACVLIALAPFRAETLNGTTRIWKALSGFGGGAGLTWPFPGPAYGPVAMTEIVAALIFVHVLPNSVELFRDRAPVLPTPLLRNDSGPIFRLAWRPTPGWSLALGLVLAVGFAFIARGAGQFVYFAF